MTSNELRSIFNKTYGLGEWPKSFNVDHETYANVCQDVFNWYVKNKNEVTKYSVHIEGEETIIELSIGPNNGIMFKNVELILVK